MTTLRELIDQLAADNAGFAAHVAAGNYPGIADALNAPTSVENPDAGQKTTVMVYPPVTLPDVLAVVPSAERVAIRRELPGFNDDVKGAIDSGNHTYMATLIEDALTANAISAETAGALAAMLTPTEQEITAPATIAGPSIASAAGLGTVTAAQVQAAMNS